MSIRVLMVDVDGVVVRLPPGRRWDSDLEADLGVAPARLQEAFFAPHFHDLILGRAVLADRLGPVLAEVAPHVSVDQLTTYWFEKDAVLDEVLLGDLAALRAAGLRIELATVQEHQRAAYLWNVVGLKDRFDAIHYAADLGSAKPERDFFNRIAARTGLPAAEHLLIDDKAENVEGARDAGWSGALWTGEQRLVEVLAGHDLRP